MTLKKIAALFLVVVFVLATMTGCGNQEANFTTVIGGPDANAELISVGDEVVTVGEFQYYVFSTALEKAYALDPSVEDLTNFDWNQKTESGKRLSEEVLEDAIKEVVYESMMLDETKKNGVELSKEEKDGLSENIKNYITQYGEEQFILNANASAVNNKEDYEKLLNRMLSVQKAEEEITGNFEKYNSVGDALLDYKSTERVTAQHILIMSDSTTYPDPETTIKEVLARVKAGEDFVALMEEFNEDPGATVAGYTFGPGEMVQEFEKAAFDLDCGEISDVVTTEYGYHIIKRLAGLAELQQYWIEHADYMVNRELLFDISVADIMKTAFNAQTQLQEANKNQQQ